MIIAKVTGWTDAMNADQFEDEHGFTWKTAYDAIDGTIAVERTDGHQTGIFSWHEGTDDIGDIAYASDGATYGVNCSDEFIAHNGEWIENNGEAR